MYSDNSGEIAHACSQEGIDHDTCKPEDKQANGVAEQMVSEVKSGTAAALEQAGLPHAYWSHAMRHFSMAWNVAEKRALPTPWEITYW